MVCKLLVLSPLLVSELQTFTTGMVEDGRYRYVEDLMALDSQHPQGTLSPPIISWEVHTPLILEEWTKELAGHSDQRISQYILDGIQKEFRIGFNRSCNRSSSVSTLNCSNPNDVKVYLQREITLGRMWKLVIGTRPRGIHVSPLGLIPKKNKPGKWHLIVDLSSPSETSINDGISYNNRTMH